MLINNENVELGNNGHTNENKAPRSRHYPSIEEIREQLKKSSPDPSPLLRAWMKEHNRSFV